MRWRWITLLIPIGFGLILGLLFFNDIFPNPTLYARFDLAALSLICSFAVTSLLGIVLLIEFYGNRVRKSTENTVLAQATGDRMRFLRRLDHELKNPLTAIRAALVNLAEDPTSDALSSVEAQTLRLSRLTSNLRKLADLELSRLDRFPVNLEQVLKESILLAEEKANRKAALSLPRAPWPLPTVLGDHDLLFLVFHNLLDNAFKFTERGDAVEVRAFEDGLYIVVEVADTGQGIPESEVPYVWEELYRGNAARGVPGSGLGLALVRAIVLLHDGQVNLRSRSGQGTVFTVRLPSNSKN